MRSIWPVCFNWGAFLLRAQFFLVKLGPLMFGNTQIGSRYGIIRSSSPSTGVEEPSEVFAFVGRDRFQGIP